ncbi:MAG: cupin domain-containing protein [Bacteroidetes bacterium]|nr:cupin domain-containing protein [Bacteroidota bacterium]
MNFVKEAEVPSVHIDAPYKRTIRHLAAPWTIGTKNFWMGTSAVEPGYSSNEHFHDGQEEAFYCIAGSGQIKVGDMYFEVTIGDLVYVEPGVAHQLINTGKDIFKVVAVVSPPFIPEKFKSDHNLTV